MLQARASEHPFARAIYPRSNTRSVVTVSRRVQSQCRRHGEAKTLQIMQRATHGQYFLLLVESWEFELLLEFRLKKQGSIVLHSDLNGISKSCCRPVFEFHDMEQARKEASTYEVAKEGASPKLELLEAHRGQPERQKSNFHHLRVR